MIIIRAFSVVLAACFLLPAGVFADDTKDKLSAFQKQQLETQQKLQHWKLRETQKQQQKQLKEKQVQAQSQAVQQSSVAVRLQVINRTGAPVNVFWVSFDGNLRSFGTIPPGNRPFVQETFAGHTWVFKTGRLLIRDFTTNSQPVQQLVLGAP
ncbi:MAG: beta domain [Chthoniobacter sp.]|jgi:hypothetical protein|nr:beta domain [Chthoniobacter sp.]